MKIKFLFIILFVFPVITFAKTFTSNQSGNWNNPAIWTVTGSGGNNTWPQTGDVIVIQSGHVILLNVNIGSAGAQNGVQDLVINLGGKLLWDSIQGQNAGFLLFASGGKFTISGIGRIRCFELKNNAGVSVVNASGSFTASECSYINRSLQIDGFSSFGGVVDINGGSITSSTGSGSVTFATGASVTGTGTVFNISAATINTQLASGQGFSVSGFTWNGTGTTAWNTASNWSGGVVPTNSSAVSIMPGVQPVISSAGTVKSITVNNNCSVTCNSGGSLSVTDSLVLKTGTTPALLNINNGATLTVGGSVKLETGTAVNLNGNASATLNGAVNLTGNSTASLTGSSTLNVNGNLALAGTSSITVNTGCHMITGSGCTMTLNSGTSLQIRPNADVTAAGPTVLNGTNCIVISSDATGTGSFIDNGNITGTGTVKIHRFTSGSKWHLVSSPITNAFSGIYVNHYLRSFTEPTNSWGDYIIPLTVPLTSGKGFSLWPISTTIFEFNGTPATGLISPAITHTVPQTSPGNNLIGNPYPSAIDWNATGYSSTNVDMDWIVIWNPAVNNYGSYQKSTGTSVNGVSRYIPLGQGFFIQTTGSSPSFSFRNSVRVHNTTQPFLKETATEINTLKLTITGGDGADDVVLNFFSKASQGFEGGEDMEKWYGTPTAPQAYTMADAEKKVTVNAMPLPENNFVIPLFVETGLDGQYSITHSSFNQMSPNFHVYLEDRLTGSVTDLKKVEEYIYQAKTTDPAGRFILHFLKNALGTGDQKADPGFSLYETGNGIRITVTGNDLPAMVSVYDMMGRKIFGEVQIGEISTDIPLDVPAGHYIVKITSPEEFFTRKIYIR